MLNLERESSETLLHGIHTIFKVIVQDTFSQTVIFKSRREDSFFKVAEKSEDFAIILYPSRDTAKHTIDVRSSGVDIDGVAELAGIAYIDSFIVEFTSFFHKPISLVKNVGFRVVLLGLLVQLVPRKQRE